MAVKFCLCGGRTEYTIKAPAFCSSCGKAFAATFGATAPATRSAPVVSAVSPSRPSRPDNDDSDYYDKNEVHELASQLVASASQSDFGIIVPPPQKRGYRIEDVLDPRKQISVGERGAVDLPSE